MYLLGLRSDPSGVPGFEGAHPQNFSGTLLMLPFGYYYFQIRRFL